MSKLKAEDKPFEISKWLVWDAYKKVKANKGAPGVDGQAIEQFEQDLEDNLYRLWNRLSSGTYFPPPVKAVEIPKPGGRGVRVLGIPSVSDPDCRCPYHQSHRADSGRNGPGAEGRTDLPPGFLWLPSWAVGAGRGRDVPGTLLEVQLGDRS